MKANSQAVLERDTEKKSGHKQGGRISFMAFSDVGGVSPKVTPIKKSSKLPHGFGCMRDEIWVSDDFGTPIADFAAFMA